MAVSDELFAVIMKQVQCAYTFGFGEGQKDFSTSRGGQTWFDVERLVADRMRRALEAAEAVQKQIHGISAETLAKAAAVRGGDAAPPAGTVPVRVAVAFDEDGGAHVWEIDGPLGKEGAWARLRTLRGAPLRSCIATIHVPLPAVPEVGAVVEGVDRG